MNNNLLQPGIARKNSSLLATTHEKQRHYQPAIGLLHMSLGTISNFRVQATRTQPAFMQSLAPRYIVF